MKKTTMIAAMALAAMTGVAQEQRFITPLEAEPAPQGLDGANIAVWQSHGWYFEPKLNRWEWQRARLMQTVEDLYTQSYVVPFLMPMLENAGAYVMSPRERDVRLEEFIIDNDGSYACGQAASQGTCVYAETRGKKAWRDSSKPGFGYDGNHLIEDSRPFQSGKARVADAVADASQASTASWNAAIPEDGMYAVYVSYQSLPNSADDAVYTINTAAGAKHVRVNQKMGGGTWIYLGHYPLSEGLSSEPIVVLANQSSNQNAVVSADAVKIGGGVGNVARMVKEQKPGIDYQYVPSDYPRFTQGARYFLQWAGAPDSVFTPSDNVNDYTDDYRCRGLWVNWMAGGSSRVPGQKGLGVPIDLSLAFHTDAGTTLNDSIIGTLGIYCTEDKDFYPGGRPRIDALALTDSVMTAITNDIRAQYEPNWTRRQMRNASYYEARVPQVPAMLLELLSHQNFADMKYGLDPTFRFTVSRAIYKGMLRYLAARDGRPYVVQPLPVRAAAITWTAPNTYRLTWKETVDELEETAHPTYYIIEERVDPGHAFTRVAKVEGTSYDIEITDGKIHSYRVVAGNDGGVSFPSEVLAVGPSEKAPEVVIVNGFTRISAPDWFDSGEIAGFYDMRDPGVPYMQDISFIGSQFEFRRAIPWMDDDAAGFGASRSNYETDVIAGNTFDYPAVHGRSIYNAGYGFVSMSAEAFAEAGGEGMPKMVDLILGKQKEIQTGTGAYGTRYKAFTPELQTALGKHAENGGSIFVSGSFIATDVWDNPYSDEATAEADKAFVNKVLGYNWRVGQASVTGEAYEVPSVFHSFNGGEFSFYNDFNPEFYAVQSPDSFYAADSNGATIMRYTENNLVAGVAYSPSTHRAVSIGFPFETIEEAGRRDALMQQILNFLLKK